MGGMVATIAALWAALHYPTADVRCITFGAQKVGDAAFVQTFRCCWQLSIVETQGCSPVAVHVPGFDRPLILYID